MDSICLERDGLMESIVTLQAYLDEIYLNKDKDTSTYGTYSGGNGVKMVLDKLRDKLKLLEDQIDFCMRRLESVRE